jgi:hypothetical protein
MRLSIYTSIARDVMLPQAILRQAMFVDVSPTDTAQTNERRKEEYMTTRTIGGWALLINALLTLIIAIAMTTSVGGAILSLMIGEALSLLFIVGLMAIWAMQPHTGRLGQIGLIGVWCLGIATGIAFLVRLVILVGSVDIGDLAPLSSALFGLVGSLLLGWATIRAAVFHPTIGWLLIVGGVLNFVGGLLPAGIGIDVLATITALVQAAAVAGYGWTLLRSATFAQRPAVHP